MKMHTDGAPEESTPEILPPDTFTLTAEVTQYVEPFHIAQEQDSPAPAGVEATDALPVADVFVLPLLEVGFEETVVPDPDLPAWLEAFLAGERITITPDNVGLFTEFADAQADLGSIYYSHPAVVGAGLMAGDLFDFVQT